MHWKRKKEWKNVGIGERGPDGTVKTSHGRETQYFNGYVTNSHSEVKASHTGKIIGNIAALLFCVGFIFVIYGFVTENVTLAVVSIIADILVCAGLLVLGFLVSTHENGEDKDH